MLYEHALDEIHLKHGYLDNQVSWYGCYGSWFSRCASLSELAARIAAFHWLAGQADKLPYQPADAVR